MLFLTKSHFLVSIYHREDAVRCVKLAFLKKVGGWMDLDAAVQLVQKIRKGKSAVVFLYFLDHPNHHKHTSVKAFGG